MTSTTPRKFAAATLDSKQTIAASAGAASSNNAAKDDSAEKGSSVQVVVRMRPPSEKEKASNDTMVVGVYPQHNEVRVVTNFKKGPAVGGNNAVSMSKQDANTKTYTFDQTYGALSTQEEVYTNAVKPLVEEVLAGFNCTVFAYGQTGTGKTFTIEGELSSDANCPNSGVIPRSIHTIFNQLQEKKYEDYSVKVSFLELYNEELADLLVEQEERSSSSSMSGGASKEGDGEKKELRIFEDATGKKGMLVHNLEEVPVTNSNQVFALLQKANKNRKVAETNLNARSSRSHYVFTITVHTKEYDSDGEDIIKTGKLYLVDLAGSECIGKSGATEKRAKEAGKINQSLLTLGRVINALVDRSSFVPYRDSKLTRLLQESLGGRAKTVIIATVSPSYAAFDETISTLDYAHRAKSIKNKPQVNQKMTKRAYMKELLTEIASLKRENEVLRTKNGIIIPPEKYERMLAEEKGKGMQIDELLYKIKTQEVAMAALQATLTEKETMLQTTLEEKAALQLNLDQTITLLDSTKMILAETQANLLDSQKLLIELQKQLHAREIELAHTQAIVAAQSKTEATLRSQAETVLSALDSSLSMKDALHAKIDRKAAVEHANYSAAQHMVEGSEATVQQLRQQEQQMQQETSQRFEENKQLIETTYAASCESRDALTSMQNSFSTEWTHASQSAKDHSTAFHSSFQQGLVAQREMAKTFTISAEKMGQVLSMQNEKAFQQANEAVQHMSEKAVIAHTQAIEAVSAVKESAETFFTQQVATNLTQLSSASVESSAAIQQGSSKHLDLISQLRQVQKERVASDAQKLKARVMAMQQTMMQTFMSMSQAFASELTEMVDESEKALTASLEASVSQLQSEIAAVALAEQQASKAIQEHISTFSNEASQFVQAHSSQIEKIAIDATSVHTEAVTAFTKVQSEMAQEKSQAAEQITALAQSIQSHAEVVEQQFVGQESLVLERVNATATEYESFAGIVARESQQVAAWIAQNAEAASVAKNASIEAVENVSIVIRAHEPIVTGHFDALSASMDKFVNAELQHDAPVGTTPQKGFTVAYPSRAHLARTASNEQVIREFRSVQPAPKLVFKGLLALDGLELPKEIEEELLAEQVEDVAAQAAPVDVNAIQFSLEQTLPEIVPAVAAAETQVTIHRKVASNTSAAVAPAPLVIDAAAMEEDSENIRPSPTNITPTDSAIEKPTTKRVASSRLAAPKVAASGIAAPSSKPTTRSRFGFSEAK